MVVGEDVVVGFFFKQVTCVNELDIGVGFVFRQHKNIDGDGGAVEQIRGQ